MDAVQGLLFVVCLLLFQLVLIKLTVHRMTPEAVASAFSLFTNPNDATKRCLLRSVSSCCRRFLDNRANSEVCPLHQLELEVTCWAYNNQHLHTSSCRRLDLSVIKNTNALGQLRLEITDDGSSISTTLSTCPGGVRELHVSHYCDDWCEWSWLTVSLPRFGATLRVITLHHMRWPQAAADAFLGTLRELSLLEVVDCDNLLFTTAGGVLAACCALPNLRYLDVSTLDADTSCVAECHALQQARNFELIVIHLFTSHDIPAADLAPKVFLNCLTAMKSRPVTGVSKTDIISGLLRVMGRGFQDLQPVVCKEAMGEVMRCMATHISSATAFVFLQQYASYVQHEAISLTALGDLIRLGCLSSDVVELANAVGDLAAAFPSHGDYFVSTLIASIPSTMTWQLLFVVSRLLHRLPVEPFGSLCQNIVDSLPQTEWRRPSKLCSSSISRRGVDDCGIRVLQKAHLLPLPGRLLARVHLGCLTDLETMVPVLLSCLDKPSNDVFAREEYKHLVGVLGNGTIAAGSWRLDLGPAFVVVWKVLGRCAVDAKDAPSCVALCRALALLEWHWSADHTTALRCCSVLPAVARLACHDAEAARSISRLFEFAVEGSLSYALTCRCSLEAVRGVMESAMLAILEPPANAESGELVLALASFMSCVAAYARNFEFAKFFSESTSFCASMRVALAGVLRIRKEASDADVDACRSWALAVDRMVGGYPDEYRTSQARLGAKETLDSIARGLLRVSDKYDVDGLLKLSQRLLDGNAGLCHLALTHSEFMSSLLMVPLDGYTCRWFIGIIAALCEARQPKVADFAVSLEAVVNVYRGSVTDDVSREWLHAIDTGFALGSHRT